MKYFIQLFLILMLILSCAGFKNNEVMKDPIGQTSSFVTVEGQQFMLFGEPYYFLGTNVWFAANLAAEGQRERLKKELDLLQELGITNLRILGASEGNGDYRIHKSFQPTLGEYDEEMMQGLDFALAEMTKRDLKAVIYLNNYWIWSGGMAQYLAWTLNKPVPNPFLGEYGWDDFMRNSGTFYGNTEAVKAHWNYVEQLVKRVNTITGIPYIEDPAIMSWQLSNEPRPGYNQEDGFANKPSYLSWLDNTARKIKSLDPNHLVSTGNEGTMGSVTDTDMYMDAHALESIDYATFHLWIKNWGWYDADKPAETYPEAEQNALAYLEEHFNYATTLNKPLTLEEFGIPRDFYENSPGTSTEWRDRYFKTIYGALYENAMNGGPLAGSNVWSWAGYGRPDGAEYKWDLGEDYVGDPPQEPQGLNSIFSSDSSTIRILEEYSGKMKSLNLKRKG